MSEICWREFATRSALDDSLADDVARVLTAAVGRRGAAWLAVSGGSTPAGFFRRLAGKAVPWPQVTITLVDERWVDVGHADSNERLVREHLLVNAAAAAHFISLRGEADSPPAAAAACERTWSLAGTFDVVVLGMGIDGHTASLFPGAPALAKGLDMASGRCCIVVRPPEARNPRLSMTLPRLLAADMIFVHVTGVGKKAVLDQAACGRPEQLPIAAVLQQDLTPVTVYWAP